MTKSGDGFPTPESSIIGRWLATADGIVGDEGCRQIELLISECFEFVADHPEDGGWTSLYRDPRDGRLWEKTFPESHMHGGGPPALTTISNDVARIVYKLGAGVV